MTANMEKITHSISGDEALEIIDKYRHHPLLEMPKRVPVGVEALDVEFPWIAHEFGDRALYLVQAADNAAGAFKLRGALVAIEAYKRHGYDSFYAVSAKNHAFGVAYAALVHQVHAKLYVPESAPESAVDRLRLLASHSEGLLKVERTGATYDMAYKLANAKEGGRRKQIPAYNDPYVVAGQGTIVDDTEAVLDNVDYAFVTGGGGLGTGVAGRIIERGSDSHAYAFEAEGSDGLSRSRDAGELVEARAPNQLYGGAAVRDVTPLAVEMVLSRPDVMSVHHVWDDEVAAQESEYIADRDIRSLTHIHPYEPTTLVGLAGLVRLLRERVIEPDRRVALIGTGKNAPLPGERARY